MNVLKKISSFKGMKKKRFYSLAQVQLDSPNAPTPPLEVVGYFKDIKKDKEKQQELFILKIKSCEKLFTWQENETQSNDPQFKSKQLKSRHLIDLLDFINANPNGFFKPEIFPDIIHFVSVNIFSRTHGNSVPSRGKQADPEEEVQFIELSWPHLQSVMEIFLRFLVSEDVNQENISGFLTEGFVLKLLGLFDSQDFRERDCTKAIIYCIYGKFVFLRPFIRKSINDIFYHYIFYSGTHNGIRELLEIIGAIVAGLAVPIKDEHKGFLRHVLLPLHTPKQLDLYFTQLLYCINQFCQKDVALLKEVILGLIRIWPKTNSIKNILFLSEIEEILSSSGKFEELGDLLTPVFTVFSNCVMSKHFQIAERTLTILSNPIISKWTLMNKEITIPILFEGLSKNLNRHWSPIIFDLTNNLVASYKLVALNTFLECESTQENKADQEKREREEIEKEWKKIEQLAIGQNVNVKIVKTTQRSVLHIDCDDDDINPSKQTNDDLSIYNPMYSKSSYARLENVFL